MKTTNDKFSTAWAPNVILVDADFLDNVAFDFTVNFERMLERRLPKADLCHWINCIALDGGLEPGTNEVQVHFLHSKEKEHLQFFRLTKFHDEAPKLRFKEDLNNLPFIDHIGNFRLFAFPVEKIVSAKEFFLQSMNMLAQSDTVHRLMVVHDMSENAGQLKSICAGAKNKDITLFAMEPQSGRGFQHQILAYSVMSALGIRGDELP